MNEQSSRSHFVFTLRISGVNEVLTKLPFCLTECLFFVIKQTGFFSYRALSNKYKVS